MEVHHEIMEVQEEGVTQVYLLPGLQKPIKK